MYHTVHAADVHEHAVGGHGLHGAGVVLADLDIRPRSPPARPDGPHTVTALDGADHAAAGTVDLSDAQVRPSGSIMALSSAPRGRPV